MTLRESTALLPLGHERLRGRFAEALDVSEADPHCIPFDAAGGGAQVHVGRQHLHLTPLRVPHEARRRIEAHRLGVQERAEELAGVVLAKPRGLVGEQREGGRMRLGEAE